MRRSLVLTLLLLLAPLSAVSPTAPAAAAGSTIFQGAFSCRDGGASLAGARVELWEWWGTWLPKVGPNARLRHVVHADPNGGWAFRVTGGETNWFIRVVLTNAEAEVSNFLVPWNHFADTAPNQNDVALHDYGRQAFPGPECPLWIAMRDASLVYQADMGGRPLFGEMEAIHNSPSAGKPYAWYDEVRWPSGHAPLPIRARHEYAHAVRHTFDGDFSHFLGDMITFAYPQHHSATSCVERTNPGFAFNEGWAQYWAGTKSTPCPGNPGDFSIERNVAAALRGLQRTCNLSRADMVRVLARNPLRIHSYQAFANRTGCKPRVAVPPRTIVQVEPATQREVRSALRYGRRWLRAVTRERAGLRRDLTSALDLLSSPLPCVTRPCAEELRRVAEPWLVRARLAQANAVIKRFAPLKQRATVRKLLRRPHRATRFWDSRKRKALVAGRRASLPHLDAAIAAVGAVPGSPSTLHTHALDALRSLRSGVAAGDLAAMTANAWLAPASPTRSGPTPPGIVPVEVEGPPEASVTTLAACSSPPEGTYSTWFPQPGDSNYPGPPAFSGTVMPARAGTAVRMVYRHPTETGERVLDRTVTTDATGGFSHGITQQEWVAGYGRIWTVQATFDGDATRFASTSKFCRMVAAYP